MMPSQIENVWRPNLDSVTQSHVQYTNKNRTWCNEQPLHYVRKLIVYTRKHLFVLARQLPCGDSGTGINPRKCLGM